MARSASKLVPSSFWTTARKRSKLVKDTVRVALAVQDADFVGPQRCGAGYESLRPALFVSLFVAKGPSFWMYSFQPGGSGAFALATRVIFVPDLIRPPGRFAHLAFGLAVP